MIEAGYDSIGTVINDFLDKLFPAQAAHLTYPEVERVIQKSKLDLSTKEQMLFLLKKRAAVPDWTPQLKNGDSPIILLIAASFNP